MKGNYVVLERQNVQDSQETMFLAIPFQPSVISLQIQGMQCASNQSALV